MMDKKTDRLLYPITSAWKKNIEEFLFSKLTPRHLEHGTGPGTHSKRHTVGGQTTRTKQNAVIPTKRPMVSKSKRDRPDRRTTTRHNTRREVIRVDRILYYNNIYRTRSHTRTLSIIY